ncbi:MAG: FGGY family carbohydrate kinase [Planctomycetota bacterium]
MATKGYLGIDAGTQGLSAIFVDEDLNVIAAGEGAYDMIAGLEDGCYEQDPADWESALRVAMDQLRGNLPDERRDIEVLCVGISGQMHGEVLADESGIALAPVRLWCDARNEEEGDELTRRFSVKMPKRITSARWLWTTRNREDSARRTAHITTPAGWLAYRLTGEWTLGIGDAAGMFPIDQSTLDYDQKLLDSFDELATGVKPLRELLPAARKAGEDGGRLNASGADILGIPEGVPVAPAEGDQPASLAGSLIGAAGMVSVSFGTSVCANSVGDRPFDGVNAAVDHFCAPDGKPINMVWLRNGTTFMNSVVEMFGGVIDGDSGASFDAVMPHAVEADPECGGLIALPFMDDEPGLGVGRGGTAMLVGLNSTNSTPGNAVKAALLSTMFNLKLGSEVLDEQGYPRSELVLSGGLTKTPQLAQVLADVFRTPVTLLESAEEGTAWGAAVMARYRHEALQGSEQGWAEYLNGLAVSQNMRFEPDAGAAARYAGVYQKYRSLMAVQGRLDEALAD